MNEYQKITKEMLEFIDKSPSCFHVVETIKGMLEEAGFREVLETEEWNITEGDYYVIRNDSSIISFRIPKCFVSGLQNSEEGEEETVSSKSVKGFHIVASHSDAPTFKIKENPEIIVEDKYIKLNTEKYGGMILSTWLDRPLSVAGRVAVYEEGTVKTKLVNINQDLVVIPNIAIHMNRDMNKGVEYNPQVDMLPLFADNTESRVKGALLEKAALSAGISSEAVLGHDLYLYVRDKGRVLGENGEFVLAPRLDDLQCVYASVKAFLESQSEEYINVCAVFDNEEVGSGTRQGADSTFLEDTLLRIGEALHKTPGQYRLMIANSFLISADNAHAVHPNHPEKTDPTNRVYLNRGIAIKYHGSQKYTTDAFSAAKIKQLCEKAGVPFQTYANRSDMAGGSTLGNISTSHVSVPSVDIGLPQLAMHSAMETAGVRDTEYAIHVMKAFYME